MLVEQWNVEAAGQLVCSLWRTLSPTIAIMRRQRGPQERYPNEYTPKGFTRLPIPDTWLSADKTPPADV